MPFSRGSSQPWDRTCISFIDRMILFLPGATRESHAIPLLLFLFAC